MKRQLPQETSAAGRERIKKARQVELIVVKPLLCNLLLEELQKNKVLGNKTCFGVRISEKNPPQLVFNYKGQDLCTVLVYGGISDGGRAVLKFYPIHGIKTGPKGAHAQFRKKYGKPYYVAVTQALVDAAYRAGFDEIRLQSLQTSGELYFIIANSNKDKMLIKQRMKSQEGIVVSKCKFQKDGDSYVIRFTPRGQQKEK